MAHFGVKYVDYGTDLKVVERAVKEETSGPGQLLGYRSMHKKLREHHHLAVPRGLVYDVMTQIDPEEREREPRKSWTKEATQGDDWYIYIAGKITV